MMYAMVKNGIVENVCVVELEDIDALQEITGCTFHPVDETSITGEVVIGSIFETEN